MANAIQLADVLELWVWSNRQPITTSDLDSWLETSVPAQSIELRDGNFSNDDEDNSFEVLAEETFEEIMRRKEILRGAYPFSCNGNRISYSGVAGSNPSYIFCLLLSHLPVALIQNEQRTAQFEGLVMNAAQVFFGGSALRIGFPWETTTYVELLDRIRVLLPSLGQIALSEPVTAGDRGWDILVVKGFCDGEFPKFVAMGNCATGRNDWMMKGLETQPEFLWDCFQSQRPGVYITFSAVPFMMDDDNRKRKANKTHLTFDRYRICELAPKLDTTTSNWVESQRTAARDVSLDDD